MKALADETVGRYVNEHFVATVQKVGTFRLANGAKNGGNVATYFCLPDRTVIHAVPGAVNAATLLKEARWAVETRELARLTAASETNPGKAYGRYKAMLLKAHADRLASEYGVHLTLVADEADIDANSDIYNGSAAPSRRGRLTHSRATTTSFSGVSGQRNWWNQLSPRARAHEMLAIQSGSSTRPLLRLEVVYHMVFESFLGEKVSTLPVREG